VLWAIELALLLRQRTPVHLARWQLIVFLAVPCFGMIAFMPLVYRSWFAAGRGGLFLRTFYWLCALVGINLGRDLEQGAQVVVG
jgi:hypothetical protein